MISKDELVHHVLPASVSSGMALSLGGQFLFSVAVGVVVYLITHAVTALFKRLFKCKSDCSDSSSPKKEP